MQNIEVENAEIERNIEIEHLNFRKAITIIERESNQIKLRIRDIEARRTPYKQSMQELKQILQRNLNALKNQNNTNLEILLKEQLKALEMAILKIFPNLDSNSRSFLEHKNFSMLTILRNVNIQDCDKQRNFLKVKISKNQLRL